MQVRIGRTLLLAIAVEVLTVLVLVLLVAVLGPSDADAAREFAARLGRWVGPTAGFLLCLLGGWAAARIAGSRHVLHGLALGGTVAVLDVSILVGSGEPFEALFVLSNVGRVIAGSIGGYLAGRSNRQPTGAA
jgi:hypothetical protein